MFVYHYLLWISAWATVGDSKEIFGAFSVGNTIEIEELQAEVSKDMKVYLKDLDILIEEVTTISPTVDKAVQTSDASVTKQSSSTAEKQVTVEVDKTKQDTTFPSSAVISSTDITPSGPCTTTLTSSTTSQPPSQTTTPTTIKLDSTISDAVTGAAIAYFTSSSPYTTYTTTQALNATTDSSSQPAMTTSSTKETSLSTHENTYDRTSLKTSSTQPDANKNTKASINQTSDNTTPQNLTSADKTTTSSTLPAESLTQTVAATATVTARSNTNGITEPYSATSLHSEQSTTTLISKLSTSEQHYSTINSTATLEITTYQNNPTLTASTKSTEDQHTTATPPNLMSTTPHDTESISLKLISSPATETTARITPSKSLSKISASFPSESYSTSENGNFDTTRSRSTEHGLTQSTLADSSTFTVPASFTTNNPIPTTLTTEMTATTFLESSTPILTANPATNQADEKSSPVIATLLKTGSPTQKSYVSDKAMFATTDTDKQQTNTFSSTTDREETASTNLKTSTEQPTTTSVVGSVSEQRMDSTKFAENETHLTQQVDFSTTEKTRYKSTAESSSLPVLPTTEELTSMSVKTIRATADKTTASINPNATEPLTSTEIFVKRSTFSTETQTKASTFLEQHTSLAPERTKFSTDQPNTFILETTEILDSTNSPQTSAFAEEETFDTSPFTEQTTSSDTKNRAFSTRKQTTLNAETTNVELQATTSLETLALTTEKTIDSSTSTITKYTSSDIESTPFLASSETFSTSPPSTLSAETTSTEQDTTTSAQTSTLVTDATIGASTEYSTSQPTTFIVETTVDELGTTISEETSAFATEQTIRASTFSEQHISGAESATFSPDQFTATLIPETTNEEVDNTIFMASSTFPTETGTTGKSPFTKQAYDTENTLFSTTHVPVTTLISKATDPELDTTIPQETSTLATQQQTVTLETITEQSIERTIFLTNVNTIENTPTQQDVMTTVVLSQTTSEKSIPETTAVPSSNTVLTEDTTTSKDFTTLKLVATSISESFKETTLSTESSIHLEETIDMGEVINTSDIPKESSVSLKTNNKNSEIPVTERTTDKYKEKLSKPTSYDFKNSSDTFFNSNDNDHTDTTDTTERSEKASFNAEPIFAEKNISTMQANFNVSEMTYSLTTWSDDELTKSGDYTTVEDDTTTVSLDYTTIPDEITDSEDETTEFYDAESTFANDIKITDSVTVDALEINILDYDYLSTTVEDKPTEDATTDSGPVTEMGFPFSQTNPSAPVLSSDFAESCKQWLNYGNNESKVYTIQLKENATFNVFCDQETDGGGWMLFQKRFDGSTDFYRDFNSYVNGFGVLSEEHWLGLENLYQIVESSTYELRIDLVDFSGESGYAKYKYLEIGSGSSDYSLNNLTEYSGNIGDSLSDNVGASFLTKDLGNDKSASNCAVDYNGAWWFRNCSNSNLNGAYNASDGKGLTWKTWKGDNSLKSSEMKIRSIA